MTINAATADLLAFALALADEADTVALSHYGDDRAAERKADGTFVTGVDREKASSLAAWSRERVRRLL